MWDIFRHCEKLGILNICLFLNEVIVLCVFIFLLWIWHIMLLYIRVSSSFMFVFYVHYFFILIWLSKFNMFLKCKISNHLKILGVNKISFFFIKYFFHSHWHLTVRRNCLSVLCSLSHFPKSFLVNTFQKAFAIIKQK